MVVEAGKSCCSESPPSRRTEGMDSLGHGTQGWPELSACMLVPEERFGKKRIKREKA